MQIAVELPDKFQVGRIGIAVQALKVEREAAIDGKRQ